MESHDPVPTIELRNAASTADMAQVAALFREYAASLDVDLCFQNFDAEVASLPGAYAAPRGHLLLAFVDGALAGCAAFRPLDDMEYADACEMKRLYIRSGFRRYGLGRRLAQALLDEAKRAGYATMLLDTLDEMGAARALYASLGFAEIPPYCFNPIAGAHYLKADLT